MSSEQCQQQDLLTLAIEANASVAIQSGLALAQKAIQLEQEQNCESLAIDFFKKAVIILEQEIIYCKGQFQSVIQTLIYSYQNKCKALSLQKIKREQTETEVHMENFDIMDPYSIYPIKKSDLVNIEGDSRFNPYVSYAQGVNTSQQMCLENLLNVVDEFEKVELNIKLLFTSMHQGVQFTKRLYLTPLIWYMPVDENDIMKDKLSLMHELGYNIEQILVMNKYSPSYEFFASVKLLRDYCLNVFKNKKNLLEENKQHQSSNQNSNINGNITNNNIMGNNINNNQLGSDLIGGSQQGNISTKLNNKFDQYKNQFLKKFKKILKTENEDKIQIDYYHCVFDLLKNLCLFFYILQNAYSTYTHSQHNSSEQQQMSIEIERFKKNRQFIYVFIREFIIKILLNDLNIKYNQYLIYSKKKQS